jgi:phosphoribosylglycinamide formyltransferase-1
VNNLAVFASGRGSNFIEIFKNIEKGDIPAVVRCLITDKDQAGAINFAKEKSIPVFVVLPQNFNSGEAFGQKLIEILEKHFINWIILAGYLKKIPDNVVSSYANKILNIHPALLPAFGGKGMYGMKVHQAVFESGAKLSGVTVHLVNEIYDAGPIIAQQAVDIEHCSSPEEIAEKVLSIEHNLYSKALKKILSNDFRIYANRVYFLSPTGSS